VDLQPPPLREKLKLMALFQYDNVLLPYQIHSAPFGHDMLLLQGSRFNSDYWLPVLVDWKGAVAQGGRVVTCDWPSGVQGGPELADYFHRFCLTLGLQNLFVVACDDATKIVAKLEADFPGAVQKSLLFSQNAPRGADLKKAVYEFGEFD
jgi:pimeloyl-ACP methyl ester carboxylesterase